MKCKDRCKRRALVRKNLQDHLALDANAELPESHDLSFARSLIYTLTFTLIALLVWSARTEVNEVVSGRGVIRTDKQPERVEHPTGGQVRLVNINSGERIDEGGLILSFETETLVRETAKQRAALAALETERARINFVIDGPIPQEMSDVKMAEGADGLLFWVEQRYLQAQLDVVSSNREAIDAALTALFSLQSSLVEELALLRERYERGQIGLSSGTLSTNEMERQKREVLEAERSLLSIEVDIAAQRAALDRTDLDTAELLAQRRREAALRLADLESNITAVRLSIAELEVRIHRANVLATTSGTVMTLGAFRAGEVIGAGEVIAEIVPEDTVIKGEVEIPASRIGGVRVGMPAHIKVETFDFTRFGELEAEVLEISPTSFENSEGETVYKVILNFKDGNGMPTIDGKSIRPGMTVTADILTESKTVLTYLLKPLRLLRDRAFTEA